MLGDLSDLKRIRGRCRRGYGRRFKREHAVGAAVFSDMKTRSLDRPRTLGLVLAGLGAAAAAACSHPPQAKAPAAPPPVVTAAPEAPAPAAQSTPASPNLTVAPDLGKQCALRFGDRQQAPKFDFDRFQLLEQDRDVLDQVATCLTTGPLKGRRVQLVGRADPRGTEEYNLALGDRRARTVVDYLKHLGVGSSQVAVSTRGALDASGRDEGSWQIDRRVDLQLTN
jgi:peptidoglycan-associated lipoprotein